MSCRFCYNVHVWAKEPKTEEDYFDNGLDDTNDFHSSTIGHSSRDRQIFFNSGNGKPCNIEFCEWSHIRYKGKEGWVTTAIYYPKYCPECGRKLDEYDIDERGNEKC